MRSLLLGFFLICSSAVHAATDAEVEHWTKQTLTETIAINYDYDESDREAHKKRYTHFAWDSLSEFLGGYVQVVRDKHLTLHPVFLVEPARVVDSGVASGISYWRVDEEVSIPELKVVVAFSLIVIATTDSFLVQSLSMEKQENP